MTRKNKADIMNIMIKIKQKFILIAIIFAFVSGVVWTYFIAEIEVNHTPEQTEEELVESIFPEIIWNKYVNHELAFSIEIPQEVDGIYKCDPKKRIQVPIKVFEDNENNIVYISQEYYYESKYGHDSELHRYVGPCEKNTYSLELFRSELEEWKKSFSEYPSALKPFLGWAIIIGTVKNEEELDKFIKENYGSECDAGDKKFWEANYNQLGVYDISVGGESDNSETMMSTTSCIGAWTMRHKVLYFPEKNKVMAVNLGADCNFGTNPFSQPYQCYDERIIDSFRFE